MSTDPLNTFYTQWIYTYCYVTIVSDGLGEGVGSVINNL